VLQVDKEKALFVVAVRSCTDNLYWLAVFLEMLDEPLHQVAVARGMITRAEELGSLIEAYKDIASDMVTEENDLPF
jgi:hypothetical protein